VNNKEGYYLEKEDCLIRLNKLPPGIQITNHYSLLSVNNGIFVPPPNSKEALKRQMMDQEKKYKI